MKKKFNPSALAIPNLTATLVLLIALINGLDLLLPLPAYSFPKLFTDQWWTVLLYPFRIATTPLSLLIYLYMIYVIGQHLEAAIGDRRYTLYILTGILFCIAGSALYTIPPAFIYLSIFLAVAHLNPEQQLLLFFVIPVKYRWLAAIIVAYQLYGPIMISLSQGTLLPMLGPLLGFANYIFFFAVPYLMHTAGLSRAAAFKRRARPPQSIHRCTVCGITEADDPTMDFRYCVDCDDHEYCSNHVHNHEHIRSK